MTQLKINPDIKAATLAKDKDKFESLDAQERELLQKLLKQRQELVSVYIHHKIKDMMEDLAKVEFFQAEALKGYLPKQMSEDEIYQIVEKIIKEIGDVSPKNTGKAENKIITEITKKILNKI